MRKKLTPAEMKYIIYRVVKNGYESIDEAKEEPHEFNAGRKQAYYEVLDTIYNQLDIYEQDTKNFGYSEDWEKKFLSR
ncbi:MAG: hypothetical protein II902_10450 [Selenomonadaceae bacterium]|nr:hypothetical protein [Selenomonadaceae bacterium]